MIIPSRYWICPTTDKLIRPEIEEKTTKKSPAEMAFFNSKCKNPTKIGTNNIDPPTPIEIEKTPKTVPIKNKTIGCIFLLS